MPSQARGQGKKAKKPSPIPTEPDEDSGYQGKGRLPMPAPSGRPMRSRGKATPTPPEEEPPIPVPLPAIDEEDEVSAPAQDPDENPEYYLPPDTRGYGNNPPPDNDYVTSDKEPSSSSESDNEEESFQILSDHEPIPIKKQSASQLASTSKSNSASKGKGRGRPPTSGTAKSPVDEFDVLFMLQVGGVSELFSFRSTASIQDLRDKAADFLKKRHHEIQLLYTTIWGKKSDRFVLNDKSDWERLIAIVAKNRGTKKGSQYQVEVHDGVNGKPGTSKATSGSAGVVGTGEPSGGLDDKATNKLTSIQQFHDCAVHGFECFVIKSRLYEPKFKLGTHQRIPMEVLLEWADDCAALPPKATINTVPEKYIPRISGMVVESDEDDEDGLSGLRLPETKPRGRTGPNPKNTTPVDAPTVPPMWPSFPYPPYAMLPPYAQQYSMPLPPTPMYPAPPASPVCMPTTSSGPHLRDWLPTLDEGPESDEESFGDLLNALKSAGIRRLQDFQYWSAAELSENVKCSLGMAKRLISDAKHTLRGQ